MARFLFSISLLLVSFAAAAQLSSEEIDFIDGAREQIKNNMASYKKVEKFRDSSGAQYAFLENKILRMVQAKAREGTVDKKIEWYFLNNQLIYCEQVWTIVSTGQIFNNEKLYLKNGHLAVWLKTGNKPTPPTSPEFKETDFYLSDYGKQLLKECQPEN